MLPAQFAFVLGAMFAAVQYAKGSFVIPTLAPIVYNFSIIAGGVAYASATGEADPAGFIWGALVGAFVGNLGIQIWGATRVGMKIELSATWKHPAVLTYIAIAFPLMFGQTIVALDETFMSIFGAMVGDGAATELQFARRTMFVPVGVIAQAAAVAAYPTLARLFAEGQFEQLRSTVDRALEYVLVLSIGAAGVAIAMSVPIMRVLFERGEFGSNSTLAAASALVMYALAIPVWGALQVITRGLYARRQMWTPVIVGSVATVIAVPMYFLMQDRFGIEGVALASVLTLGGYTAALFVVWYRPLDTRDGLRRVLESAGRTLPLAVPAGFAAFGASWLAVELVGGPVGFVALVALLLGLSVYGLVAIAVGAALHDSLWRRSSDKHHSESAAQATNVQT